MVESPFAERDKFSLVAVTSVNLALPKSMDYRRELSDGTWILRRVPLTIDSHWRTWIGTIRLRALEESNLVIMYRESGASPQAIDAHDTRLNRRLSDLFQLLQLSHVLEYEEANLLSGSFSEGKVTIRQMRELPLFYQTRGYTRVPVSLECLEEAVQLRNALDEIHSARDDFRRLKWGLKVLLHGLQQEPGEERIHEFVRSLEGLVLPEIGQTKRQFVHRSQTFTKASPDIKQILEETFDLRSMAEHLNNWEDALKGYAEDRREIVALHRTRQMEKLASFAYSRILRDKSVRSHFVDETRQREFWQLPDDTRKTIWGDRFDLTSLVEVREFDGSGRALADSL